MKIQTIDSNDIDMQRWIYWMDAKVFPEDYPVSFVGSHWFIGFDDQGLYGKKNRPVCYAAWRPHYHMDTLAELHWTKGVSAFLYRAGVLVEARGHGYQKDLIKVRETAIIKAGITTAITYTDPTSAASMCSMIASGYKPYEAQINTNLAGSAPGKITKFVHWKKTLI